MCDNKMVISGLGFGKGGNKLDGRFVIIFFHEEIFMLFNTKVPFIIVRGRIIIEIIKFIINFQIAKSSYIKTSAQTS